MCFGIPRCNRFCRLDDAWLRKSVLWPRWLFFSDGFLPAVSAKYATPNTAYAGRHQLRDSHFILVARLAHRWISSA